MFGIFFNWVSIKLSGHCYQCQALKHTTSKAHILIPARTLNICDLAVVLMANYNLHYSKSIVLRSKILVISAEYSDTVPNLLHIVQKRLDSVEQDINIE